MTYKNCSILFVSSFSLLFFLSSCQDKNRELEQQNTRLDSLSTRLEMQARKSDSLHNLLEKSDLAGGYPIYFGRKYDSIENPEIYIEESLKKQRDLIPLKAVLGGTMEFRNIQILTEEWLLAIYDDGHIQGKSIFEFKLQPDGEIVFKEVISKYPE